MNPYEPLLELGLYPKSDIIASMRWMEIRAHYAALHAQAQAAGMTQKAIAERGGIAGQNSVSRMLSNDHRGPTVEIFVRAIIGLGKSVSQFFLEIEQGTAGTPEPPALVDASIVERLCRIEHALQSLGVSLAAVSSGSPVKWVHDAPPHASDRSALLMNQQSVDALVKASIDSVLAERLRRHHIDQHKGEESAS